VRKIKVLHISPNGELYGTERHILSIVKYADRNKFEHCVATPVAGNFNQILAEIGVRCEIAGRIPNKKFKLGGMAESGGLYKLVKLVRKEKFDIIHTHLNSYGGFVSKLVSKAKVVHTRHGVFWTEEELRQLGFLSRGFQRLKSRVFDVTVAIGEYEKDSLVNILGYDPLKVKLTYNGVSAGEIKQRVKTGASKKDLFHTEDFLVGAVGRLEKQKGFDILLYAAKKVLENVSNVKFVIIGDGSLKNHLVELRKQLGLENKFEFVGYKKNIYEFMNCFDVMVQTSLWEGISYVVLEAMAMAKPVIAVTSENVSGVKEIIQHGKTGYLVDFDYSDRIGEYILELVYDRNKSANMGTEAYERVSNVFSEKRTASDMERTYLELAPISAVN
jgi:glycosyltransferase involved in cell wall biosynthesis